MRRLYVQIYLTVLGVVVLMGLTLPLVWWLVPQPETHQKTLDGVSALLSDFLPAPDEPPEALEATLQRMSEQLNMNLSVRDVSGKLLAAVGEAPSKLDPKKLARGWIRTRGGRTEAALRLPDGRWLMISPRHQRGHPTAFFIGALLLCGVAALGAYPLVRRITRRLENLQRQVDELGTGDFSTRVQVEGSDEVADLARSFNRAADRIERLVDSQRNTLASASHELRSPLTRMRIAIELLARDGREELRERVTRDIAELDELIDELLLASRLDAATELSRVERIDLLALLAEEAARTDAAVSGASVSLDGDPRMLRRMIRNLLENARRHGGDSAIEASVAPLGDGAFDGALIQVADRGPGVPQSQRERIFEPFYRPLGMREGDGGVGLGLALVRRIARHHGGDARCVERDGGGTRFEVTLRNAHGP
jgi:signal transduction histidine kinase